MSEKMLINDPGNVKPADVIYAWLSIDEKGNEGIMAANVAPKFPTPLVSMNLERLKGYTEQLKEVSNATGKKIRLVKYHRGEILDQLGE